MGAHIRFGGHFVQECRICSIYLSFLLNCAYQAHVDSTATVLNRVPDGDSLRLTFQLAEPSLLPYLIPKGYVTVDGASLTITGVNDADRTFSIMLIQHTQEKITLSKKPIGATVNVEVDMVGKYVEKSVIAALGDGSSSQLHALVEKVVEQVLVKKGIVKL
jgi:riboflavin synthase